MKYAIQLLSLTLLFTTASADQEVRLRYGKPSGVLVVSTDQDIRAGEFGITRAGRTFSMDMALSAAPDGDALAVTINKIKGSYTAHDMKQRLPTSHLDGQVFNLFIIDDGRALERSEPGPVVDLGWILEGGFQIGMLLADLLPVLPETAVGPGSTWTTERKVLSLEGWTLASGQMHSRHRVTAVEEHDGHLIVSIESEAEARLGAVDGVREYSGEGKLERTLSWQFDATTGWLVSMTLKQETTGINELPQGLIPVHQITTVELALGE